MERQVFLAHMVMAADRAAQRAARHLQHFCTSPQALHLRTTPLAQAMVAQVAMVVMAGKDQQDALADLVRQHARKTWAQAVMAARVVLVAMEVMVEADREVTATPSGENRPPRGCQATIF